MRQFLATTISLPGTRSTICTSGGCRWPSGFCAAIFDHKTRQADDVIVQLFQPAEMLVHRLLSASEASMLWKEARENIHGCP